MIFNWFHCFFSIKILFNLNICRSTISKLKGVKGSITWENLEGCVSQQLPFFIGDWLEGSRLSTFQRTSKYEDD
jgi:hypothetical protein